MKRFRRGITLLVVCALLLCGLAYADGFADWSARYNTAAAAAGLAPIADKQDVGYGAYGITLDEGDMIAVMADDSTVASVIITGVSSRDKLALVCGAALYACDSTLTIDAAMERMSAFISADDGASERFLVLGGWVYLLETDGTQTLVCLMSEDMFASFVAEGMDFPFPAEDGQPSLGEATPSEPPAPNADAPSQAPVQPEATPNPVLHKI